MENLSVIPESPEEVALVTYLAKAACETAFQRHAGKIRSLYGPSGKQTVASGKDLTSVTTIIGTGGPLSRLDGGERALRSLVSSRARSYPKDARVLIDRQYIMAACGVLSREFPQRQPYLTENLELRQ